MSYTTKNYGEQGGDVLHIGGVIEFGEGATAKGGFVPNIETETPGSDSAAKVRTSLNALITALKDGGVIVGDDIAMTYTAVTDSEAGHADRQDNTNKISSVDITGNVITITLSKKVSQLKDFDGGNGWGVHKWLGIGLCVTDVSDITNLKYNGASLTAEDVAEATECNVSNGFVRWVAADLVLAGDNTKKSVDNFTLWASGHKETEYKLVIVEPS
jgi:hypothetical protein